MDIHLCGRDYPATFRDGVMGVGPEGYAEHDHVSSHRMSGWDQADSGGRDHDTQNQTDKTTNQDGKTLQLEVHGTKRSASLPLPGVTTAKKIKTGHGIDDYCENEISTVHEAGSGPRARTETPSKPASTNGQFATKTPPSKPTDDDSEPEIVAERPSSFSKRKSSVTSASGSANKQAKHIETVDISDDEDQAEIRGAKGKAPKQNNTPVKPTTPSKTAQVQNKGSEDEESEFGEDAEEDGGEDDDDEEAAAAEEEANFAREIAKASKDFDSTCKRCKISANKALKTKYDLRISKIRSDSKHELKKHKSEVEKTLLDTKSKFDKEKKAAQQKYDDWIKRFKTSRDDKVAATKNSHDTALGKLQGKYDKEKEKVKELTRALEEAETRRKDVEKSANKKVKDARADFDAGEQKLKEEKKQMVREMQEKVNLLKPEHSKTVKDKDRNIKELAQEVVQLERDLKGSERHMYDVRKEAAAEKSRHDNCKNQLSQAKMNLAAADKKVKELSGFAEKTQHRAETDKVRAKEKIELAVLTRNEQSQRLIVQQRENYELKDTVRKLAKLGGEKRDEVERLKAELKSTKAELGVAKDMEGMGDTLDEEASATMASSSGDMVVSE
jgi:hypothetical protein